MPLKGLRIFVSSPGDVIEERVLTARVINRLKDEFATRVAIEPIFWEHEPLRATETFQNQITRPSETDIVICILWSRLGTRLPSKISRPDGTPYSSGTEYEFEDAVEGHRHRGIPDLLVYRKMADPVVSLQDEQALLERLKQKKALDNFVNKWFQDTGEGSFIAAFHPFRGSADYEELLEIHLRKLIRSRLPESVSSEKVPSALPSWTKGSPFRGLEVFEYEHASIFFGRTRAAGLILNSLRKQAVEGRAFVLVLGMSGCGKSSLVRAGVVSLLTQPGVIEGVGLWRRAVMHPGDTSGGLLLSLANALLREEALPELGSGGVEASELAEVFRDNPKGGCVLIKNALTQVAADLARKENLSRQPEARLVLVVDQLEEMFTVERVTPDERRVFMEAVSVLAWSGRVWVITTLRSDFYPRCMELPALMKLKEGIGHHDLFPPTPAEISQMIRQPALAAGLRFEEDLETGAQLDDVLRDAAAKNPASLPLLEFALDELYKKRTDNGLLTHAAYGELGGLEGAIAQRAESVFKNLDTAVQVTLPAVLRALMTVGVGEDETVARKSVAVEKVCTSPEARILVSAFVEARLFITDLDNEGRAVVSISHEALLRHWPRLQNWIAENKEFLLSRARIAGASARWLVEGKSPDFLLSEGKPLAEAQHLLQVHGEYLDPVLVEYINASIKKQSNYHKKKILIFTSIFLIVFISAIFSSIQWRESVAQGKRIEQQLYFSNIHLANGYIDRNRYDLALKALWDSPESQRNLEWGYLLNLCNQALFTITGQPGVAMDVKYSPDGSRLITYSLQDKAKAWDVYTGNELYTFPGDSTYYTYVKFNPEGSQIVAISADSTVLVLDAYTGKKIKDFSPHLGKVLNIGFIFEGSPRIMVASSDSTVQIWDIFNNEKLITLNNKLFNIQKMEFSPEGSRILAVFADSTLKILDARYGNKILDLSKPSIKFNNAAFSPDGSSLITTAYLDNTVKVWDAYKGTELMTLTGHKEEVIFAAYSLDGQRIVTISWDRLKVWEKTSGKELADFPAQEYRICNRGFLSPDNSNILVRNYDNTISILNISTGKELIRMAGHSDDIIWAEFSPEGSRVVTSSLDGTVRIWDSARHPAVIDLTGVQPFFGNSAEFCPAGGLRLVTASARSNDAIVWDPFTGTKLLTLKGNNMVSCVSYSPDGSKIATSSFDNTIKIWNSTFGKELLTIKDSTFSTSDFSFDGSRILTKNGSYDKIWDATSGKESVSFDRRLKSPVNELEAKLDSALWLFSELSVLSPDGSKILIPYSDGSVKLFETLTGKELGKLVVSNEFIYRFIFSPDGSRIVTCSQNDKFKSIKENNKNAFQLLEIISNNYFSSREKNQIIVWNTSTITKLTTISEIYGVVNKIVFHPAGALLAIGISISPPQIWNTRSGAKLFNLSGHSGRADDICFSPDGSRIVTASSDKTIKIWDTSSGVELITLPGHSGSVTKATFSSDGSRLLALIIIEDSLDTSVGKARIWRATPWTKEILSGLGYGFRDWKDSFESWRKENISDIDIKTYGRTQLIFRALKGDFGTVKELLKKGAHINEKDNRGRTALMEASANGRFRVVQELLKNGADINVKDNSGETALSDAATNGNLQVVQELLKTGAEISKIEEGGINIALERAAGRGYLKIVQELLKAGADVNYVSPGGFYALSSAIYDGHFDVVKELLNAGADVNLRGQHGKTPIMHAVWRGDLKIFNILIKAGAEVNARFDDGGTPFWLAQNAAMIRALVEAGATLTAKEKQDVLDMGRNIDVIKAMRNVKTRK